MNIGEMHIWFRDYAQHMGMQNVRAILPSQIDSMINTSISDIVNELIRTNVGLTNDRIVTNNSKIGQINALRTLYRVKETTPTKKNIYTSDSTTGKVDCSNVIQDLLGAPDGKDSGEALFLVDFAVSYDKINKKGVSKWFPIAIVEDSYLADSLQDYTLRPTFRQPVGNIYVIGGANKFDVWFGEKGVDNIVIGSDENSDYPTINTIRVSYITKPKKVKYVSDLGGANVDCNLPESMHVDILKHAVDLYRTSIAGNLYANQQAEEGQQREIARNNARPTNEGYQS